MMAAGINGSCFGVSTMPRWWIGRLGLLVMLVASGAVAADGNRLSYLDSVCDPYYVHGGFPKLATPQWIGEDGVEAVVVLAIDDMRATAKYENYLRPILDRLKQIDGRAPVSIMTCNVDPADPQLQAWLAEGLSIEVHTVDHPCPLLKGGDFAQAKGTYDRCVDLLNQIPGNRPVAFRMPCCDSRNTPSPRFWSEIFDRKSPAGNFLQLDTSVFNITTPQDDALPRALVLDADGGERFRKYLPFPSFVNTIEDYPYPYVIGGSCWEFPCIVPSDWEAQNLHQPNNPRTVADMKAALDAVVLKQGTFNLVFHPHGWIRNDQVVELIDHAVARHGGKVKFLTFREAIDRINANLLQGHPLRRADGGDNGVRLLDLNDDHWIDVVHASPDHRQSRVWQPATGTWQATGFPITLNEPEKHAPQFGVVREDGFASVHVANFSWQYTTSGWQPVGGRVAFAESTRQWHRLRDLDGDGICERIERDGVWRWRSAPRAAQSATEDRAAPRSAATAERGPQSAPPEGGDGSPVALTGRWVKTGVRLPELPGDPRQTVRFLDVNQDGSLDLLVSGNDEYAMHLYVDLDEGWRPTGVRGRHGEGDGPALPRFFRPDGTNHGVWAHSQHLWIQNEDTDRLPDGVDRVAFDQLIARANQEERTRDATGYEPPREPKAALATMRTTGGEPLVVELVAAEPLIQDPVAFDWGPDGRLWVVEMRDYPNGIRWHGQGDPVGDPGGRVKILSDEDGDGQYDTAATFLDAIPFPTGIKVWREGALISAVPDILYAVDTDGDDVADRREVLYRGFATGNQQHRANGLRWGLDNWLHVANGDSGGTIESLPTGRKLSIRGRDLRIQPDSGDLQAESGQTQFGRNRDDWGNWFGGNNSNPMWHYVLDDTYLRRNPHVAPPSLRNQVSEQPGAAPVFPTSLTVTRFNDFDRANRFTSACSPIIYRDTLCGDPGQAWSYVCEPVHNLVHRELVSRDGLTFTSRRAPTETNAEFLSSTDNWFRPTMVRTGPDGAIWIADMYRLVIEHPEWIPADWQERLDLRGGSDRGRIYRVRRKDRELREVPRFDGMTTEELVAAIESPNGTQRDLVHQMLIWQGDPGAVPKLQRIVRDSQLPQARVQALCALDGLDGLDDDTLLVASRDPHFAVRRHAIRLAEPRLAESRRLAERLVEMCADDDPQVRLQVAYSLGALETPSSGELVARMAATTEDPYLLAALHSSLHEKNVLEALHVSLTEQIISARWLDPLVATAVALDNPTLLTGALQRLLDPGPDGYRSWQFTAVATFLDKALGRKRNTADWLDGKTQERLAGLVAAAEATARDRNASLADRQAAIELLARLPSTDGRQTLTELLAPRHGTAIQVAAARGLAGQRVPTAATAKLLLDGWNSHTPGLRAEILDLLLSRTEWSAVLLDAVQAKDVQASHLNAHRRQQLTRHKETTIRTRAAKLFSVPENPDRQQVVAAYGKVTALAGDPQRGRELFAKHCATCHRWRDVGHAIGPDLAALTDNSVSALLTAVLDPNRAVEDKFLEYVAVTQSGRQHRGMIQGESANSISLVGPNNKITTLLRTELDEFRTLGKSLMPEGLEKEIPPQDLANIFAYLRESRPALRPKTFPGNQPQVAPMRDDGSIRLLAIHARIYGPSLVFEEKYRNLGWWSSPQDHAVWQVRVPRDGTYHVTVDYACADGAAGDRFVIQAAGQALRGVVAGTGTWDDYRSMSLGTLTLPAGLHDVTMRSDGAIGSALIDLRSIRLSPR